MSRKASFALFAGLALVLANAYRDTARANGWAAVASSWKQYGLYAGVVLVGAYVANMSDRAATFVLVVLAVLWLLFAMHIWGMLPNSSATSSGDAIKMTAKTKTPPAGQSVPSAGPANVKRIA